MLGPTQRGNTDVATTCAKGGRKPLVLERRPIVGGCAITEDFAPGFKAPTLYQLHSDYGNLALQPERAHGWDAGVEQHFGRHFGLSATWFDRDTRNLIQFAFSPPRADYLISKQAFQSRQAVSKETL